MVKKISRKLEVLVAKIKLSVDLSPNEYMRFKATFEEEIINQNLIITKEDSYELGMLYFNYFIIYIFSLLLPIRRISCY